MFLTDILPKSQGINEVHRSARFISNIVAIFIGTVTTSDPATQRVFFFRCSIWELLQISSHITKILPSEFCFPLFQCIRTNIDVIKITEIGLRPGEKLFEELLNDKEKTTATVNKKIMIAKVKTYDYTDVCANIDQIIELAGKGDVHAMVFAMKKFVPEYKSQQSKFESIDKEIEQSDMAQVPSAPDKLQPTAE